MGLIVLVVGFAFYETTQSDFKWQVALTRLVLALVLSIPSAYLARESSKHREQQYAYLQTSMDLKAIDPYIASLPEDTQHKIKANIADRIFASKDFSSVSNNSSYPINTHELMMELIKKVDVDKEKSSADKNKEVTSGAA